MLIEAIERLEAGVSGETKGGLLRIEGDGLLRRRRRLLVMIDFVGKLTARHRRRQTGVNSIKLFFFAAYEEAKNKPLRNLSSLISYLQSFLQKST